jgi:hypothetical protein
LARISEVVQSALVGTAFLHRALLVAAVASLLTGCRQPQPPAGEGSVMLPPDACVDRPPTSRYTCQQEARWGKCDESWMHSSCDQTCGRCYRGAASCPARVNGERMGAKLRFDAPLTSFTRTFELRYNNPNHPDYDQVRVARDPASRGHYTLRASSWTVYGTSRIAVVLDLETGEIVRQAEVSGHDLGTVRVAFPPQGDAAAFRKELAALREIVARVQAGYWLADEGFEQPALAELIGPLCYIDALDAALVKGATG